MSSPDGSIHLAIGIFDGVHDGHRAILEQASGLQETHGGQVVAFSFWPHPSHILYPEKATPMILSKDDRVRLLKKAGADYVHIQEFTQEFSEIQASEFPNWLKNEFPALQTISVGQGFEFGKGRKGDAKLLQETAANIGIEVLPVDRVDLHGVKLSSTRIRKEILEGNIPAANEHLGYPYFASGKVIPGQALGRKLGFPTLNLDWLPNLRPPLGVYAVWARPLDDEDYEPEPAVANYGIRPTVDNGTQPVLEVHLLDPLYPPNWEAAYIEFETFLRPEKKFSGQHALRKQIAKDIQVAHLILG